MPAEDKPTERAVHASPVSGLRLALRVLDATAPSKAPRSDGQPAAAHDGSMLFEDAVELVSGIVVGLNAGLFTNLGIDEESGRWQHSRIRALALLEGD